MKLIDDLMARAAADDRMAGDMAAEESARMARTKAYDELGSMFDQAAADGYLDKSEIQKLMSAFRSQGLDTSTLQQLAASMKDQDRVAVSPDLRYAIDDELGSAKSKQRDPDFNFKVQTLVGDYNQCFELAANVQKAENDMYMTAIKNLVA